MTRPVTVSVVFTDLVGSTEMASRLGPGATDAVRQVHFGLLRDAVSAQGGTEVKNLGDGLMVVFDGLGSALDGAVQIQQAIHRHNERGGERLGVRVGLSAGDATTEDGDYFGAPVVEAARLCAKADGGQILTTELVSLLARSSGHTFEPAGLFELKGIPEPVAAVAVAWTPAADPSAPAVPLPTRLAVPVESALVGRADEWATLERARKAARAGERRVVLVCGEPGVGKSRLAAGACRAEFEVGAVILYGRSDEDLGVPYQPWVEAIGHLVEHVPEEILAAHVADHGGELGRLVPQLSRRIAGLPAPRLSDPETERYVLFQAVTALIAEVAAAVPVVMVLDDLHGADKPTLMLLRHVVGQSATLPLLVLGTYRDSDVSKGSALADTLAALRREPGVERIALDGLDDAGVLALLESLAGHEMDEVGVSLAHAIRRETAGNPFFVGEILRSLTESGAIYQQEDGRWVVRDDGGEVLLPESVREVVGQRVGRLGDDGLRVLSAASVLGHDFDLSVLARVLNEPEDDVFAHLEEATAAALIREVEGSEDRFTFVHALVRHTLDDEVPGRRRRQLHQRAAEVIEELCGVDPGERVGELAGHWLAATIPAEATKALHYTRLAGERALAHLAPDEAVRWFGAALDLMADDHPERCKVLVGLGDAQRQTGDPVYRGTLLEAAALAQRVGDTDTLVAAALANNRGLASVVGHVDVDRMSVLEAALEKVGEHDGSDRARLLALLASELSYTPPFSARVALADEAIEMARRLGDAATFAEVAIRCWFALMAPGTLARRRADIDEARRLAEELGDPLLRFWVNFCSGASGLEVGDLAELEARMADCAEIVVEVRQPMLEWFVTMNGALRACLAGDTEESEQLATAALELAEGQPDSFTWYSAQLMGLRLVQGRSDELLPLTAEVAAANPEMSVYTAVLALSYCEVDQDDEARALLEAELAAEFPAPYDITWTTAFAYWASVAAHLQHQGAADVLYERLAPFEDQLVTTSITVFTPIALSLGELAAVLGRPADAERHFHAAEQLAEQMHAPYIVARTRLAWATALARAGRPEDADRVRTFAQQALDESRDRYPIIERRAKALL